MSMKEMDALKDLVASFDLNNDSDLEVGGVSVGACALCCNSTVGGGGHM